MYWTQYSASHSQSTANVHCHMQAYTAAATAQPTLEADFRTPALSSSSQLQQCSYHTQPFSIYSLCLPWLACSPPRASTETSEHCLSGIVTGQIFLLEPKRVIERKAKV